MTDLATLGLAVDSGPVKSAASDLRDFSAAAKSAQSSADGFNKAASGGASPQQQYGNSVNAVAKRLEMQEARLRLTGREFAVYQNLVSAGVTIQSEAGKKIAAATRALYDMEQQQKSLRAANDNSTSALDRFASRFTRGLIAGAAIAAVQQLTRYLLDLNAQLAATADTAQRVGVGNQQFQGLQTAAGYKGIGNSDFNAAMLAFNQQVDLARHGLGDLQALLRLNGKTVSDTATTFGIVADLVKNAGSEAQKFSILQSAGLPSSREFVKLMEQGADKIRIQPQFSKGLTDQQLTDAQRVNDQWQKAWTDFENWGKRSVVNVASAITRAAPGFISGLTGVSLDTINRGKGADLLKSGQGTPLSGQRDDLLKNIYNATGAFGTEQTTESAAKALELERQKTAQTQQRLSLLGPLLTAEEARKQVELQITAAGQNLIFIDDARAKKLAQIAYETNLGITSIKASADALNVEAQTIGMSAGQAAAYSAAQSILNEKKRLGIAVTDEQREAIIREAEAMGRAKDSVEQLRFAHDTFQSGFVEFGQQIRNGASAWDAFRNAGVNALGKIADKLMQMAADNLWRSAFGGTSGFGGLLGGLFGGATSSAGSVGVVGAAGGMVVPTFFHGGGVVGSGGYQNGSFPAYLFASAPRFHNGSDGVGLKPDEIPAILQRGERVIRRGANDNGGNVINMPISVNASGNDPAQIAAAIRSYVNSSDFDARVVSSVTTAKKQRKLA